MKRLLWIGSLSYFLIGLAHVVVGSLLPVLLEHYGRNYTEGGSLIFAQFSGFLAGVLLSPWLARQFGKRRTLVFALLLLCAAEVLYSLLPPWGWLYAIGAVAGFGFGMVEAVIGTIVISGITEGTGAAMSRLEVFFGIGALAMPAVASQLIALGWWRLAFPVISVCAAVAVVAWLRGSFGKLDAVLDEYGLRGEKHPHSGSASYSPSTGDSKVSPAGNWRLLALFIIFFFIYVGTEMSLANFLPSMFIERLGLTQAEAALSVTCFWLAMAAGRLFAGNIADRYGYGVFVFLSSLAATVLLCVFPLIKGTAVAFVLIALLGLGMSGIFSIALVFASKMMPGTEESTTSLLIGAGGVGGALLPLWLGNSMDRGGAVASAWLLAGFACILCLLGGILYVLYMRKKRLQTATS
ncbi:major facilitator superfamily mfs_1 [Paenibacillus terrae HPL-003]|uniref:Major facilitator superfamily mfs_1 n=1 Tax=Paenibacillus terrae (strain HPL-003) TaxID=985665 RepID=G7W0Y9_PAETH|nr:MFS transporter [Paenibacillus terrae]AET60316.1 major facilitator superfamily mfs_1 [Paenibacillus terrae HPL-003]